ncbi:MULTISPECIES: hypothetical protein [unclassified Bartonella]|uniref:hypothetical protein n=1 Tax=unclassified Bartonella TaxID=2645622 RepID=UPI0035D0A7CA
MERSGVGQTAPTESELFTKQPLSQEYASFKAEEKQRQEKAYKSGVMTSTPTLFYEMHFLLVHGHFIGTPLTMPSSAFKE